MGPFVSFCRRGLLLLAAPLLVLGGCESRCEPTERIIELSAPYSQFFSALPNCLTAATPPVVARSSGGLTESFQGSCVSRYTNSYTLSQNCETTRSERRSIYALSALYGYNFSFEIEQYPDGPHLTVRDQSLRSNVPASEITYNFASGQANLNLYNAPPGTALPATALPTVTALTNFSSGGRSYAQVWRITNPLNAAQGRPTSATVFYLDRDRGLIRFDQRDGTVWTLEP